MNEICKNCRKTKAEHHLTAPATSDGICTFSPSGLVAVPKEFVETVEDAAKYSGNWLREAAFYDAMGKVKILLAQMKKEG